MIDYDNEWALADAVERHRLAPASFQIPPEHIRASVPVGADAKLIFSFRSDEGVVQAERMWVRILGRSADKYSGVLNYEPTTNGAPLSLGDRVSFRPEHIIDVIPPAASRRSA